jgi:hypothetical protein
MPYPNPRHVRKLIKRATYVAYQSLYLAAQEFWHPDSSGKDNKPLTKRPSYRVKRELLALLDNDTYVYWQKGLIEAISAAVKDIEEEPFLLQSREETLDLIAIHHRTFREWIFFRLVAASRIFMTDASLPPKLHEYLRNAVNDISRTAFMVVALELKTWRDGRD